MLFVTLFWLNRKEFSDMRLNLLWDFFFATVLLGKSIWYFIEKPSRLGVSKFRQGFFYLGMSLALILLVGPVAHAALNKFQYHMIQHIGLMMLISPLIVLGSPIKVAYESNFGLVKSVIRKIGGNILVKQLFRAEVGFVIFLAVLISTHFSPLANAGMVNPNIHELELILFLVGGFIYYYPVLEGNPQPFHVPYFARVLSLFAMMLPETMTGFFLYSGNHVLHHLPKTVSRETGLLQQHTGGAIMWALGMVIDAIWIALAVSEWIKSEKRLFGDE
jgi:cytochrome c oxidase assembly factor CtaG